MSILNVLQKEISNFSFLLMSSAIKQEFGRFSLLHIKLTYIRNERNIQGTLKSLLQHHCSDKPRQHIKKQRHLFADKDPSSQSYSFSNVVLERRPQCAVSREVRRRGQGASRGAPGKSGLHASGEGERVIAPRHGRGLWPRDVLKKVSRGLSRVEAGNPGFPRLVQVTSGGFSWWL